MGSWMHLSCSALGEMTESTLIPPLCCWLLSRGGVENLLPIGMEHPSASPVDFFSSYNHTTEAPSCEALEEIEAAL